MTEIDPKLSRLYREAATESPPAALDAVILAAARKQVAKPTRRERSQRQERSLLSRWMVPAGAMATLVLGVSIALLVEREHPETIDDTTVHKIAPRPESPAPARVTESAKAKTVDSAAREVTVKTEAPAAAVPAQAPVLRPAKPASSAADVFQAEGRAKATAPRMETESNVASDSAIGGLGAAAPAAPAATGKLAPMRQHAIQRSPEAWLDEISRLKRDGHEKQAAEQFAEFRKAYPAYAVPETLLK